MDVVNQQNFKYRYVKFVMDDNGGIDAEYDFPVRLSDECVGEVAAEILMRMMDIIKDSYPMLLKNCGWIKIDFSGDIA